MEVGGMVSTAIGVQFTRVWSKFGPQAQQFFTLGLLLPVGRQGSVPVQVVEAFAPDSGARGRHVYEQIDRHCFWNGLRQSGRWIILFCVFSPGTFTW